MRSVSVQNLIPRALKIPGSQQKFISLVPMQCTGNSGCFPWKTSSRSAALPGRFIRSVLCAVSLRVFLQPAVKPTVLRQMDMGSLTCAHIGCVPYTRGGGEGSGTNKSAQELTRRNTKKKPERVDKTNRKQRWLLAFKKTNQNTQEVKKWTLFNIN